MEHYRDSWNISLPAEKTLKVIVVGAGIAGLVTGIALRQSGHDVVVLEQAREIVEVGAGIQMAPNNLRILGRLGLLADVVKAMNIIEANSLRRWENNEELGLVRLMPKMADTYGAPLGVIHRGDLQQILLRAANQHGCQVKVNHKVIRAAENFEARVQVESGQWFEGDIVIAADGIKSSLRKQIAEYHNHSDRSIPTGDAAYRILIPEEKMKHDPAAMKLLSQNVGMRWMGPGGHIMAYPIRKNTVYNMVLLHPDSGNIDEQDAESWVRKGNKTEMMDFYRQWCPEVRNLLSYVPDGNITEWTLKTHAPLPVWHENKVVLIGDACHPMLPYVAQGAAQAMEDAAVLQVVLAKSSTDLNLAIEIFEQIRKTRGETVQLSAATTREALHLPDGPAQEERDRSIKAAVAGIGRNPDLWADPVFQNFVWGADVMMDTLNKRPSWKTNVQQDHHRTAVTAVC